MGRAPLLADKPIIGPIWVRLRDFVISLWLVANLRGRLQAQAQRSQQLTEQLADQEARLIAQDQESAAQAHDSGAMAVQVIHLQRRLDELEARLAALEKGGDPPEA